jgi:hypothetical protein
MKRNRIVLAFLGVLILCTLALIVAGSWPQARRSILGLPPVASTTGAETQEVLKEKLESYNKRADDLQKVTSLLLGLSAIYAIVLAVSAYAAVQSNLEQAKTSISEAKASVSEAKASVNEAKQAVTDLKTERQQSVTDLADLRRESVAELKTLREQSDRELKALRDTFAEGQNKEIEKLRKELEGFQDRMDYATRISVATLVSNFPLNEKIIAKLQHESITSLRKLRDENYATDEYVNLRLARLYRVSNQLRSAEAALTLFIERKEKSDKPGDPAIEKAYFNRACYRSLRWATASQDERSLLSEGIRQDLGKAIGLDEQNKKYAQGDDDFQAVKAETWFRNLVGG